MKLDILAFGAHPDDVELGCGALLAKEIQNGKKIGIIDLTRGELGTRGTPEIRKQEALNASKTLGAAFRKNLKFNDGFLVKSRKNLLKIITNIREYQPDLILCNPIRDRHPDHQKGNDLVVEACFLSGLRKIKTFKKKKQQAPWRPSAVYHYIQWLPITPDVIVDVSGFEKQKIEAVKCYKSQFYDSNSKEPKTPISSVNFLDSVSYRGRDLGRIIGVDYAEGFTASKIIGVDSLFYLK